jgi:hypothetical protein
MNRFVLATTFALCVLVVTSAVAETWTVPFAGNTFRTQPSPGRLPVGKAGLRVRDPGETYSTFVRVDRPADLQLAIAGRPGDADAQLRVTVGEKKWNVEFDEASDQVVSVGRTSVSQPGYLRVDVQNVSADSKGVDLSHLVVKSETPEVKLDFVRDNDGGMFYWGRRGPSVHLSYRLPKEKTLEYAYSEVTVPRGEDQIGSFFMANGFGEGYFGFQVNGDVERRVLFSVWSPYRTDDPSEIPPSDRVETLAKGPGVRAQDFGNEGSGGQSFLVFPWKAGVTYCFLTQVKPDGQGNTRYTSWFAEKDSSDWRLIASFRRPKTDKPLTGFHSFLENFSPSFGHLGRSARYGNQWVRDTEGRWHEVTRGKFTGDGTARGRHRLDYAGGVRGEAFYLRNCGFFDQPVKLDQVFERSSTSAESPEIDLDQLERMVNTATP